MRLIPNMLDGVRGGLIEVGRQNILENLQPYVDKDASLWTRIAANSKIFGEDFLYGMAGYMALTAVAKVGKLGLGTIRGVATEAWQREFKALSGGLEYDEFLTKMTAGNFTADELKNMDSAVKEAAMSALRKKEVMDNVHKISKPEAMELFAMTQGIEFKPAFQKAGNTSFDVQDLAKNAPVKRFNSTQEAYDDIGRILKGRGFVPSERGAVDTAFSQNNLKVHTSLRTYADNLAPDEKQLLRMTEPELGGRLNRRNATYVIRELVKKSGGDEDLVNSVAFLNKGSRVTIGENVTIKLPANIKTIAQEEKYLNSLVKGVKKALVKKGVEPENLGALDEFARLIDSKERLNGEMTPLWVKYKAEDLNYNLVERPDGRIVLKDLNTNTEEVFAGYMSAGDFLYKQIKGKADPAEWNQQIITNAKVNFGDTIKMAEDGSVTVLHRWHQR